MVCFICRGLEDYAKKDLLVGMPPNHEDRQPSLESAENSSGVRICIAHAASNGLPSGVAGADGLLNAQKNVKRLFVDRERFVTNLKNSVTAW